MSSDLADPRSRLFVALDIASVEEAGLLVERLGRAVTHYKIGYQLAYAGGLAFGQSLVRAGKTVFFDLKLHDIDNTVRHGVQSIVATGAHFLTIHAYPQTMRAAVEARAKAPLKLLAVTVLTSWNDVDCAEAGYAGSVRTLVAAKARQAAALGIDGIVSSAEECRLIREAGVPETVELVTPGIRPAGEATGDQKRVVTPTEAIRGGATRLVVGRAITAAGDPVHAAHGVLSEIRDAIV